MQGAREAFNKDLQGVCDSSLVPAVVEADKGDGDRRGNRKIVLLLRDTIQYWPLHNQVQARLIGGHNGWIRYYCSSESEGSEAHTVFQEVLSLDGGNIGCLMREQSIVRVK